MLGLLGVGFYALLVIRNLIRTLIALQILVKAAVLALVLAGTASGQLNLAQSLAVDGHRRRYRRGRGGHGAGGADPAPHRDALIPARPGAACEGER